MSWKKIAITATTLPFLFSAQEQVNESTPSSHEYFAKRSDDERDNVEKNVLKSLKEQKSDDTCYRALLPSARHCPYPQKECRGSPVISASFLIWQSKIWGLEFAGKSFAPFTNTNGPINMNEKAFVPDFAWRPGVKASLGYNLPYDGWDLIAGWTFFHDEFTNLKKHFNSDIAPPGMGIVPLWRYPFQVLFTAEPIRYGSAAANWKMFLNEIDLDVGRLFYPSPFIPVRLFAGGKGAWIRQNYHVEYGNGTTASGFDVNGSLFIPFTFESSTFTFHSDQWGVGPRLGFQSKWNIWRGFNLIGDGAFSLLCSWFDMRSHFTENVSAPVIALEEGFGAPGDPITHYSSNMKEDFVELTPILEAMLGFNWGSCFGCKNPMYLDISIGYEYQYWWTINHVRRNYNQVLPGGTFDMRGDLQMQGLTATVKLDF